MDHTNRIILIVGIVIMIGLLQFGLYTSFAQPPISANEHVDYDDSLLNPYEKPENNENTTGLEDIPILGFFITAGEGLANGLSFLWSLLTFDIPQLPLELRVIFTSVFWATVGTTIVLIIRGVN